MTWFSSIFTGLAGVSFALGLWQWWCGRRFPLWRRRPSIAFAPPLSILKPLKGCDAETNRCLESWFKQEYPGELELLFGVASADDPVCDLLRELMVRFPARRADVIITDPVLGANAKVSTLCYLSKRARFQHLVVSDADVFITPNFLSELVASLSDVRVGIVSCFYIQADAGTLPMRMEAVAGNADFWTHVLQAVALKPMDFALGAVMALRNEDLEAVGGFKELRDFLADDYELGKRLFSHGKRMELCTLPVQCRSQAYGWKEVWEHQVRWGRTIRVCRPVAYFFSILGNGTLWPLLALFTTGSPGLWIFAPMLAVRIVAALSNYARLTRGWPWWVAPITPLQDLGQALVWFVSFIGNEVVWRGERFRVNRSGKLTRVGVNFPR